MSDDLFLAILAMDAYNRDYGAGILLSSDATTIGTATIEEDSIILNSDPNDPNRVDEAVGFYAISYTWNGQTVISYRGTDNYTPLANANGASDIISGWAAAAGQDFAH